MSKLSATLLAFILVHIYQGGYGCQLNFIAAYGDTDGEIISRSAASYGKTVLFTKAGQYVLWHFVTQSSCNIDILNVIYSNDGPSDNITLYLDSKYIGGFQSVEHTREGVFWNKMVESGLIGKTMSLSKANHTLTLNVSSVDIYGYETDKIIVGVLCDDEECSLKTIDQPDDVLNQPGHTPSPEGGQTWNRQMIVNLVLGVSSTLISILIAIPTLIVAFWSIYKCIGGEFRDRIRRRLLTLKEPLLGD